MTAWAPGATLGPYELSAPLGAGGMGEVWKARDTRVDRIVALKRPVQEMMKTFERIRSGLKLSPGGPPRRAGRVVSLAPAPAADAEKV